MWEGHSVKHWWQIHHLGPLPGSNSLHLAQTIGSLVSRSSSILSLAFNLSLRSAGVMDAHMWHIVSVCASMPAPIAISTSVCRSLTRHVSACFARHWPCGPDQRQYVL